MPTGRVGDYEAGRPFIALWDPPELRSDALGAGISMIGDPNPRYSPGPARPLGERVHPSPAARRESLVVDDPATESLPVATVQPRAFLTAIHADVARNVRCGRCHRRMAGRAGRTSDEPRATPHRAVSAAMRRRTAARAAFGVRSRAPDSDIVKPQERGDLVHQCPPIACPIASRYRRRNVPGSGCSQRAPAPRSSPSRAKA